MLFLQLALVCNERKNKKRHCEVRSNPKLYRAALLIGDCFVPRNDIN
jgi:hypothetical protein